jgi:hypothetical protein
MKDYTIEDIRRIARPTLGKDVPLELFRILRIIACGIFSEIALVPLFT